MLNQTPIFVRWLRGFVPIILSILMLLTAIRMMWFFSYGDLNLLSTNLSDVCSAFLLGLRFDLSDICYFSTPGFLLTLIWMLTGRKTPSKTLFHFYIHFWVFWLMLLLVIAAIDFKYYSYFQDHINILIFGFFQDDTWALLKTFWHNYPFVRILLGVFVTYFLLYKIIKKFFWQYEYLFITKPPTLAGDGEPKVENSSKAGQFEQKQSLWILIGSKLRLWSLRAAPLWSFLLLFLGARGSLGLFPLEIMHTAISKNQFINVLTFNGPHALARAIQLKLQQHGSWNEGMKKYGYTDRPEQAISDFLDKTLDSIPKDNPLVALEQSTAKNEWLEQHPPHVVFVLMESMGSDWLKRHNGSLNLLGSLEKHFQADFLFKNFMPASAATIGSLGTLLTDLPPRMMAPFLTDSEFIRVPFSTAPAQQFKKKAYDTHFIYGGNLGWRDLAKFVPLQGFDHLHSEVDLQELNSGSSFEKHDWGVYDEYVFQLAEKILKDAKKPQFIFILTTTNHPPYTLPSTYSLLPFEITETLKKQLIGDPLLNEKRLQVYQYANQQLGLFIDKIKASEVKQKTLLAATGDHSFYILPYNNEELLAKWGVPFYLYLPQQYLPPGQSREAINSQLQTYGSHVDIFPTLFHLALADLKYTAVGSNLLAKDKEHWAIHSTTQSIFNENGMVFIHSNTNYSAFNFDANQKLASTPLTESLSRAKKHFEALFSVTDLLFENEKNNFYKK